MSYGAKNGQQWVIYDNAIVDVAGFRHPGPQKLISNNLGRDVTKMFDQRGHSEFAKELCERMTVGYIGDETVNGQLLNKAYANMSEEEKAIHKRLQDPKVMDITKPLCPQVAKLTNREFIAFVRRPRFMGGNDDGVLKIMLCYLCVPSHAGVHKYVGCYVLIRVSRFCFLEIYRLNHVCKP